MNYVTKENIILYHRFTTRARTQEKPCDITALRYLSMGNNIIIKLLVQMKMSLTKRETKELLCV